VPWLPALLSFSLFALPTTACRKKTPPSGPAKTAARAKIDETVTMGRERPLARPRPDAAPVSCPPPQTFAGLAGKKGASTGRALETACVVLYEGFFWGAAALAWNEKGPARPSLHFLTGGPQSRTLLFDVEPAPAGELAALIRSSRKVAVTIRRSRGDGSLVRMGVVGQTGTPVHPESREIGVLLQLVAHAPPKILWWGPGDETSSAGGCLHQQTVDFELMFRTRLERITTTRSRPLQGAVAGKLAPPCSPPSSRQENLTYQATALKSARPL
jgi:hypothetical protein